MGSRGGTWKHHSPYQSSPSYITFIRTTPPSFTQIACGMHHVAGVASRVSPTGKMPEEGRRTRLVVWGKGSLGQLGAEAAKDSGTPQVRACSRGEGEGPSMTITSCTSSAADTIPSLFEFEFDSDPPLCQVVAAVDGKRILHISCGGHHTLAVCEHDPKDPRRSSTLLSSAAALGPAGVGCERCGRCE